MICEECKNESKTSKVFVKVTRFCDNKGLVFWDEIGKRHIHPYLKTLSKYECSNGHKWSEPSFSVCWCGWSSENP